MIQFCKMTITVSKRPDYLKMSRISDVESSVKLRKMLKDAGKLREKEKVVESCEKWQKLRYRNYPNYIVVKSPCQCSSDMLKLSGHIEGKACYQITHN